MYKTKGYTMIEIIVVMIIMGILAALAVPSYINNMKQGSAVAAEHNLITIFNAEKIYFLNNGAYCTSACSTLANINLATNLGTTNIVDSYFTYKCTATNGFTCTATNISNTNFTLAITAGQIVLPGGTGCTTPAGGSCNPKCSPSNSTLCPTS